MDLNEYIEKKEKDRHLFYKLPSGQCENLLDEAIDLSQNFGIEEYKKMLIELIKHAETENQRENLTLLIELFKNKFKQNSKLIKYVWDIENSIYILKTKFY